MPAIDDASIGRTQMGGAAWYLMNTTPREVQAAAWEFMKFMNSAEAQAEMLIGGSYLPYRASTNDLPEVQSFYTEGLSGQWLKIANDEVAAIDPGFPGPLIGPYDEFREAMAKAADALILEGASPSDALGQAQSQVDAAITRYRDESF
jgi:sn-glycerol 3-phosphate transport system substrate-binding protein